MTTWPRATPKYRNTPLDADGLTRAQCEALGRPWVKAWDSKREYERGRALLLQLQIGAISDLRRQVRYPLVLNGVKLGAYVADFVYREGAAEVVEDVKGVKTPVYRLKKKLVKALYGAAIRET